MENKDERYLEVMAKLQRRLEKLEKENKKLMYAADKSRLAIYDNNNGETIKQLVVSLREYKGKLVTGWKMTKNMVEKINGVFIEDQELSVYYQDKKIDEKVPLRDFEVNHLKVPCTVLSTTIDKKGNKIFEVEIMEGNDIGKKIRIQSVFVN